MESFFIAFNAVGPLASYILMGVFIKKIKAADDEFLAKWNSILFKIFYPILMFNNLYKTDFSKSADMKVTAFILSYTLCIITLCCIIVPHFIKKKPTCSAFIQAVYRSNIVLFGLPLTISIFGAEKTGIMSVLLAFAIPLYNSAAVILLEYYSGESANIKALIINVFKNPLIKGALAGLFVNFMHIPVPSFMQHCIADTATGTTLFALIILGASLKFSSLKANAKYLFCGILLRLVIIPTVAVTISYFLLGFREMQLFTILVVTATPVATSAYTMAQNMGSDHEITAQFVAISTILSVFTIFLWIMMFSELKLI